MEQAITKFISAFNGDECERSFTSRTSYMSVGTMNKIKSIQSTARIYLGQVKISNKSYKSYSKIFTLFSRLLDITEYKV